MPLTPDKVYNWNGLKVNEYFLTTHNPYGIAMPGYNLPTTPLGVTIHNTDAISVASNTTMAEQYTRATVNGNMKDVRVHFYVDDQCAWQNLPFTLSGWHAADGNGNGNRKTIAIEVIGNSAKAEANAVKLAAYLLNKFKLNVNENLFTHTYWLNVRDGFTGSIDYLNTKSHPYKVCPIYIIPHWSTFKANVAASLKSLNGGAEEKPSTSEMYRIRKEWTDAKSQIGAYTSLENAKKAWKEGYKIFNSKGEVVYPTSTSTETPKPSTPATKPSASAAETIDVIYRTYTTNRWLPEVKNCEDYAGIENQTIRCMTAKAAKGVLHYRVHIIGGGWLGWITEANTADWYHGYAGLPGYNVDGVQAYLTGVDGYEVEYRVSKVGSTNYYPWVKGVSDYAGEYGRAIDKLQMRIVKK